MKNILFAALILAIITSVSCNKDDDDNNNNDPEVYQSKGYIQLNVGNYWIYQHYRVREDGTDTITSMIDTVFISETLEHNGETYYKVDNNKWFPKKLFLRDSLGNMIDTLGNIFMSENNFSDTLYSRTELSPSGSTLYHLAAIMYDENKEINTPIDNFTHCIEKRHYIKYSYNTPVTIEYIDNSYYAKGVGLVQNSYTWASSGTQMKRKLIEYYAIIAVE